MSWFNPFEGGGTGGGGGSSTAYATSLVLSLNTETYVLTATLKNKDGDTLGTPQVIDLPLETMVVSGRYDENTKMVILVLSNGQEISFSVADLISGLQSEITVNNKLDIELIDCEGSHYKIVWVGTSAEYTAAASSIPENIPVIKTDDDDMDQTPTENSENLVSSGGVYSFVVQGLAGKANSSDLGTAASKDVPASGDASTTQVVMGNDTRLTDSRPASDVSAWAKALTKPSYNYSEITNTPTVDNAPAENSTNLVKSGGVYTAIAEKQNEINSNNKLSADLVTDVSTTNKFVTAAEKSKIAEVNDKYPIAWDIELTQEEYANLPDTKYNDGKNYYIIDGDEEEGGGEIEEVVFYDGCSLENEYNSAPSVAPFIVSTSRMGQLNSIKLVVTTVGKLSIGTIKVANVSVGAGLNLETVHIHEEMTFTTTGEQTYELTVPMIFDSDDYIVCGIPTDTAIFKYGNSGADKGFYYVSNNKVTISPVSLGITFSGIIKTNTKGSTYKGKTLSILGDSISTFSGYIPSGNVTYYPQGDVRSVNDTWWKKLMDALGMTLDVNNSWSGSYVTTVNGDTSAGCGARAEALGESPDVIIVWMGVNDFGNEVGLGTYDGTTAVPATTTTFREAYAIMLNKILQKYKTSEVWVCTLPQCEKNGETGFPEINGNGISLVAFNKAICELAEAFGVKVLDHNRCGLNYQNISIYEQDSLHPNKSGHSLIANNDIRQMDNYIRKRYV